MAHEELPLFQELLEEGGNGAKNGESDIPDLNMLQCENGKDLKPSYEEKYDKKMYEKREKNRISAQKSRAQKTKKIEELEMQARALQTQNAELQNTVKHWKAVKEQLEQSIQNHHCIPGSRVSPYSTRITQSRSTNEMSMSKSQMGVSNQPHSLARAPA